MIDIKQATITDLQQVSNLFAEYRLFYNQSFDIDLAETFIKNRLTKKDSVIFVAINNGQFAGFIQLYPSFTSVGLKEIWVLNDLFIKEHYRKNGIAQILINHVLDYSKKGERKKVVLSTAFDNIDAQRLYEKSGFTKTPFLNYEKLTE